MIDGLLFGDRAGLHHETGVGQNFLGNPATFTAKRLRVHQLVFCCRTCDAFGNFALKMSEVVFREMGVCSPILSDSICDLGSDPLLNQDGDFLQHFLNPLEACFLFNDTEALTILDYQARGMIHVQMTWNVWIQ